MGIKGLVVSAQPRTDNSAYTHRLATLADCLERRGIECDIFCMPDNFFLYKERAASLLMPLRLGRLREYDFVQGSDQSAGQALFFCRPFLRGPIILDMHGDVRAQSALANEVATSGRKRSASLRVKRNDWMAMKCAHHVLTVSTPQTETLIRLGYPRDRISLIRNGVDLKFFRPLPFDGVPPFTFGYVGQFQVWQGTENLIEAFERIDGPSIRMLVVGFTEKDGRVKDIFHDRFGPRVELVNRTDRNSIVELIKSVAILIIPRIAHQAIRHAFPTKFAEYAALGRPIVVNDVDETADFVRKYNCGFVSEPNPEAMAAVMSQAAQVPLETLEEMGKRARQMAEENFSWEMIGDEYAALIRRLIPARQQGK